MPLRNIVVIVLRLFAILDIFSGFVGMAFISPSLKLTAPGALLQLSSVGVYFIFGIILFWLAPGIARLVTPKPDVEINTAGLTLKNLYCFAFVFLGLYFALTAISGTLYWLYRYADLILQPTYLQQFTTSIDPRLTTIKENLVRPGITFLAGLICLIFAAPFSRALARLQQKYDPKNAPNANGELHEKSESEDHG